MTNFFTEEVSFEELKHITDKALLVIYEGPTGKAKPEEHWIPKSVIQNKDDFDDYRDYLHKEITLILPEWFCVERGLA
jgi:hypothetical protein